MGSVYLADDIVLGESEVAVKVLRHEESDDPAAINRFLREVRLTHKIHHHNVVRTFDFGRDGDAIFYTMEYLPGQSLELSIVKGGAPCEIVVDIMGQLMHGLAAVHEVGVVHRDLKPTNVIIGNDGVLKITDFGIARSASAPATRFASDVLGTIRYVAPEVLQGKVATRAVDFYALGVVIFELLTGMSPFNEENPAQLILSKIERQPRSVATERPDIPEWLAQGVNGLLAVDPDVRMEAVRRLAQVLDRKATPYRGRTTQTLVRAIGGSGSGEASRVPFRERSLWGRYIPAHLLWVVLCALFVWPISHTEMVSQIELGHADALFQWRGLEAPDPRIVIVSMDEQSYISTGVPLTSPWPRGLHAKLLTRLADAGATRVVFDVIFSHGSDENSEDVLLVDAMRRVPTVLGAALGLSQRNTINGAFLLEELMEPASLFEVESVGVGVVGLPQQLGRVRELPRVRSDVFPNVSTLAEMAVALNRADSMRPQERAMINFYGPSKTIPTIPYELVVSDDHYGALGEMFKDKVVFVGLGLRSSTGASQRDAFVTPYDQQTFGVEIHATVASNLLSNSWIRQPHQAIEVCVSFASVLLLATIISTFRGFAVLLSLSAAVAAILVIQYALFLAGWFVPMLTGAGWGIFSGLMVRIVLLQPGIHAERRRT